MDAEYVGYSGDWICDEHGVCTPANLVKYEVEETKRWVEQKLAQIRREEATNVPYCFKCNLPIGKEFGTHCICRIPDVTGASLVKLRSTEPVLQLFDIERNNRADEMERLEQRLQLELEKKKLEIIQAQRLKETELQSERFNALTNTVKGFSFKDPSPPKTIDRMTFSFYLLHTFDFPVIEEIKNHIRERWKSFDFERIENKECWDEFMQAPTFQDNISIFKNLKSQEKPVDTNYTGKSVLSYLLQLDFDLLCDVLRCLMNDNKWRSILFKHAYNMHNAISAIVWAIPDKGTQDRLVYVNNRLYVSPPEETITPPYYEEDFVQPLIK